MDNTVNIINATDLTWGVVVLPTTQPPQTQPPQTQPPQSPLPSTAQPCVGPVPIAGAVCTDGTWTGTRNLLQALLIVAVTGPVTNLGSISISESPLVILGDYTQGAGAQISIVIPTSGVPVPFTVNGVASISGIPSHLFSLC